MGNDLGFGMRELRSRGIYLSQRRGQHFLLDKNMARKIVGLCGIGGEDEVIEIGGGVGHLTEAILACGSYVKVFENDGKLVKILEERFGGEERVEVIGRDFLEWEPEGYGEGGGVKRKKMKIMGNIPYYLSSRIIEHCLMRNGGISGMVLMVQKELGQRILAGPGSREYSSLSLLCQGYARVKRLLSVRREVFFPVPKVDSEVIGFEIRDDIEGILEDEGIFEKLRRGLFMQRRKKIWNALRGKPLYLEGDRVLRILKELDLRGSERGECLSVEKVKKMAGLIAKSFIEKKG